MSQAPTEYRELLLQALGTVEDLQARLATAEKRESEPIAVVGIGCRFPGKADDPEALWQLLQRGDNAVGEVPADRWDIERYYSADRDAPGKMYCRHGGFLDRVDLFEPEFFGISPREARTLDPQQRLVLEVAWEALEHGGVPPTSLRETQTGVFVGIGGSDFAELQMRGGDLADVDAYVGSGSGPCFAAGRLSYVLGLRGPSLAVDTACSSSLVAVHLACQSLRQRECDLALAGGVHVMLSPFVSVYLSRTQALAGDGRSKVFDADADGFVRGEGCGMVVLKRLSDALAARDSIVAVVRGSALSQDGPSSGLTVPNGPAQAAAIRAALEQARLAPAQIGYVEAHGTGTSLGDPIELNALCRVLGEGRPAGAPLVVGSVKCNLGHLEAAAGVAGFIKAALVIQRGVVPPHLHFARWNPEIDFQGTTVVLPDKPYAWQPPGGRYAGVSAFGLSGTNAHVVLGEAPPAAQASYAVERSRFALRVTARTAAALAAQAGRLAAHLQTRTEAELADVCYTSNVGRAHFAERAVVVAGTLEGVREGLSALAAQAEDSRVVRGSAGRGEPTLAFLFPGQGPQYAGMARSLYDTQPVFRAALDRCDTLLREHLDLPLLRVLYPAPGEATPIDETRYAQPLLFCFEYALASVWQAWGAKPAALLGHSLGEYAAACVAGLLPLEDAVRLVAERGRLMGSLPPGGAMAAVFAPEDRVREALRSESGTVSIAAINGPENVVLSGARDAVERVSAGLVAAGVEVRPINVPHAAHSGLLDPVLDEFQGVVACARFARAQVPIISNVTGQPLTEAQQRDPVYWRRHAREAVRFADGVRALYARGIRCFVEMGPHTTACGMAAPSLPEPGCLLVPSLRKGRDDWEQLLESLSQLYVRGTAVAWERVDEGFARRRVHLPTYAFQRERHWLATTTRAPRRAAEGGHPLLGARQPSPLAAAEFAGEVSRESPGWVADHVILGTTLMPAAGFVELGFAARRALGAPQGPLAVESLEIEAPLPLEASPRLLHVTVEAETDGRAAYVVRSAESPGTFPEVWRVHARGRIGAATDPGANEALPVAQARPHCTQVVDLERHFAVLRDAGFEYGPAFRGLRELRAGGRHALGLVEAPPGVREELARFVLHPALLDAALQVLAAPVLAERRADELENLFMPVAIGRLLLARPAPPRLWCSATLDGSPGDTGELTADLRLEDEAGNLVALVTGLQIRSVSVEAVRRALAPAIAHSYELQWQPAMAPAKPLQKGRCLLLGADGEASEIAAALARHGWRVDRVAGVPTPAELAAALGDNGKTPAAWILDCRALDPPTCSDLLAEARAGYLRLLQLAQSLEIARSRAGLCVVTLGAQAAGAGDDVSLAQAPLLGLARTIGAERQAPVRRLDLDASRPLDARTLVEGLGLDEPELAERGGQWLAPRLRELPSEGGEAGDGEGVVVRSDATYLVTGGLGGLGLSVAEWLAQHGARELVLLGRRAPRPEEAAVLRRIESHGAHVLAVAVDVGDRAALQATWHDVLSGRPPLRGIVHAAGVIADAPLVEQDAERLELVARAKIDGAWYLHELAADCPLDFFALFSSAAALFGSPGQASYAAGNAFLDGLARFRRARGLPATSLAWGAWGEVGLAARVSDASARRWSRHGVRWLRPADGLAAFGRALATRHAHVTVVAMDRAHVAARASTAVRALLGLSSESDGHATAVPDALAALRAAGPSERPDAVRAYLRAQAGGVLGLASDRLDPATPLASVGLDSLMAVQLKSRMETDLSVVVPIAAFLRGTVDDLTATVLELLKGEGGPARDAAEDAWEEGAL